MSIGEQMGRNQKEEEERGDGTKDKQQYSNSLRLLRELLQDIKTLK